MPDTPRMNKARSCVDDIADAQFLAMSDEGNKLERELVKATRLLRQVTKDIKWVLLNPQTVVSVFNKAEIRNTIEQADKYLANKETP